MKKYYLLSFLLTTAFTTYTYAQQTFQYFSIAIPTREENTLLAADLYTTDTNAAKPVILIQTPYNKNYYRTNIYLPQSGGNNIPFDSINYNYVVMDWRGFYGSKSAAIDRYDRGLDGYDAIEWIAGQRWCNGKVGTYGASALGLIQFQTAKHHPPHLVCAVPLVKDYKTSYSSYYYGGDYRKEHVETLAQLGFITTELVLAHPERDLFWTGQENSTDYPEKIAVPMLLIGGWFDHFPNDVIRAFNDLRARSDTAARDKHRFLIGPWLHSGIGQLQQGEMEYPNAVGYPNSLAMQFFDFYLRNESNNYENTPTIQYYQLGEEIWHSADDWNTIAGSKDSLFLSANHLLTSIKPFSSAGADSFYYDPRDPSPAYGGSRFNPFIPDLPDGPRDISPDAVGIENRADVLILSTEPVSNPITINETITLRLYVSSDRKDTDFGVRLCDVYPDDRSMIMTQGIKRMRFRDSCSSESFMVPDTIYPVEIELQNLALTIKPGHRLKIVVSSSIYPHFDINLNNGGLLYVPGDTLIAHNTVYFNKNYPSCLIWQTSSSNTNVHTDNPEKIEKFILNQNYPNPFNPNTVITYELTANSEIVLKIYDMLGREIVTLANGIQSAGTHTVQWDGRNKQFLSVSSGVYLCRLETGTYRVTRKLMLLK